MPLIGFSSAPSNCLRGPQPLEPSTFPAKIRVCRHATVCTQPGNKRSWPDGWYESGVSVVAVRFSPDGRRDGDKSGAGWDDHAVHGNIFKIMRRRGPQFDQAVSALIEDLESRGLDRQVLLVVAGEFGRTPKISYVEGVPGRDHWGPAGCVLLYGGSMRMGQVIGATNRRGEFPTHRPLKPQDVLASIYQFLGVDARHEFVDFTGRPLPILPYGEPIRELMA